MGIIKISSHSYDSSPPRGNPDPCNYEILHDLKIGRCLILTVRYHDCKNYEGTKILVYLGTTLAKLKKQKKIDPHFSDDPKYISPVARFVPTERGFDLARKFAKVVSSG